MTKCNHKYCQADAEYSMTKCWQHATPDVIPILCEQAKELKEENQRLRDFLVQYKNMLNMCLENQKSSEEINLMLEALGVRDD